jgi:hypothetical protein
MKNERTTTLEDVLDLILSEEQEPSHEALLRWCKEYPEHADALTRFFATWAVQNETVGEPELDEARIGNLLVSHALDLIHRQKTSCAEAGSKAEAKRLSTAIASKSLSEEEFATACGLDESLVAKLDRRLINVLSIPLLCFQRVGDALSMGMEAVRAMLSGPPIALTAHKARVRPTPKVEDFIDAVKASDLSEDQKQEWARAIEMEK